MSTCLEQSGECGYAVVQRFGDGQMLAGQLVSDNGKLGREILWLSSNGGRSRAPIYTTPLFR